MKKVINISIKILLIFMVSITLFCTFGTESIYAADDFIGPVQPNPGDSYFKTDSSSEWDTFDTDEWDPSKQTKEGDSELLRIGNSIIGPIQVIGSLVSVIAIIIIGIKYMLGSVEERAQYKETLGPYFIGAVFVFGITNILAIIYDIVN